jgi:hypothetical protein
LAQRLLINHTQRQAYRDGQIRIHRLATWRLALIRQPFVFNLRAQPNCHIATLTQAFIVLPPVGDLVPFLVKLMPTRRVEFMRQRVLPVGKEIYGLTETPVSMQQRRAGRSNAYSDLANFIRDVVSSEFESLTPE